MVSVIKAIVAVVPFILFLYLYTHHKLQDTKGFTFLSSLLWYLFIFSIFWAYTFTSFVSWTNRARGSFFLATASGCFWELLILTATLRIELPVSILPDIPYTSWLTYAFSWLTYAFSWRTYFNLSRVIPSSIIHYFNLIPEGLNNVLNNIVYHLMLINRIWCGVNQIKICVNCIGQSRYNRNLESVVAAVVQQESEEGFARGLNGQGLNRDVINDTSHLGREGELRRRPSKTDTTTLKNNKVKVSRSGDESTISCDGNKDDDSHYNDVSKSRKTKKISKKRTAHFESGLEGTDNTATAHHRLAREEQLPVFIKKRPNKNDAEEDVVDMRSKTKKAKLEANECNVSEGGSGPKILLIAANKDDGNMNKSRKMKRSYDDNEDDSNRPRKREKKSENNDARSVTSSKEIDNATTQSVRNDTNPPLLIRILATAVQKNCFINRKLPAFVNGTTKQTISYQQIHNLVEKHRHWIETITASFTTVTSDPILLVYLSHNSPDLFLSFLGGIGLPLIIPAFIDPQWTSTKIAKAIGVKHVTIFLYGDEFETTAHEASDIIRKNGGDVYYCYSLPKISQSDNNSNLMKTTPHRIDSSLDRQSGGILLFTTGKSGGVVKRVTFSQTAILIKSLDCGCGPETKLNANTLSLFEVEGLSLLLAVILAGGVLVFGNGKEEETPAKKSVAS